MPSSTGTYSKYGDDNIKIIMKIKIKIKIKNDNKNSNDKNNQRNGNEIINGNNH